MLKNIFVITIMVLFASQITQAESYDVDKEKSKIKWHAEKVTGEHDGYVQIKSGSLDYSDGKLEDGEFVIDMKSISNTDIEDAEYRKKLEGHLKSDDFFAVEKFPEAKFEITKVEKKNGKHQITGNLTIKGITNKISFPADITASADVVTAIATIKIDRSKYNVQYRSKSFFDIESLGDKMIYDEFTMSIHLVANK